MDPRSLLGAGAALAERPVTGLDQPEAARAAAPRRARVRPEPQRSAQFAELSLEQLRAFRKTLNSEEAQVSYWRRILQARLDVVRAGTLGGADSAKLRPLLTDARLASSRQALCQVVPVAEIPPLPSLAELWDRQVGVDDTEGLRALEADLAVAERQISDYRRALHVRIDEATAELIARYRETPGLCLDVLPTAPARPVR